MLGQHMAETGTNEYSFSWDKDRLFEEEYRALGEATVMGQKENEQKSLYRRLAFGPPELHRF